MHERRKPGWVIWLLFVAFVPVLYILSSGPAKYLLVVTRSFSGRGVSPTSGVIGTVRLTETHRAWTWIYGPLDWTARTRPGLLLQRYWDLFPVREVSGP